MKNYEKYADEIREYKGDDFCIDFVKPHVLKLNDCVCMDCEACSMYQTLWLLEDYEEPETDWSKVEVDTPILVRHRLDGEWYKRHFVKYENGYVYAWDNGKTSWTENDVTAWNYAKLAESNER